MSRASAGCSPEGLRRDTSALVWKTFFREGKHHSPMSAWLLACLQTAAHGAKEGRDGIEKDTFLPSKEKRKERRKSSNLKPEKFMHWLLSCGSFCTGHWNDIRWKDLLIANGLVWISTHDTEIKVSVSYYQSPKQLLHLIKCNYRFIDQNPVHGEYHGTIEHFGLEGTLKII